ncbi:5-formyltetrahydrofolate cyclo-ligase [Maribius pontilimi]|uniref:5-formyltetrahydrofolate cyclo-ligase n=1 Tax=Palleronia pontilimi TaxID=1964209 RepID=A0A934IDI1_9RHOB|nr:5-formyltetrahydrofolate cyclo-ligase [Palleronia pontilimi]MBJ3762457.1 5-formyltetrahydrofolate cyclo-ligase [Palleronia pontilimi]
MTPAEAKAAARRIAFAARARAHAAADARQADNLIDALRPHLGRPLAGYHPIRTEIDPTPAMALAAAHGPVALPVIDAPGLPLSFHGWTPDAALRDGPFGARIPVDGAAMVPEILIVPLVAFDRHGGRLGYGGGFYDRTLQTLRAARATLAIGFAFAAQETACLPLEATDQPLDLIVTEREILVPRGR